jgi:hypothetical protein
MVFKDQFSGILEDIFERRKIFQEVSKIIKK